MTCTVSLFESVIKYSCIIFQKVKTNRNTFELYKYNVLYYINTYCIIIHIHDILYISLAVELREYTLLS